MSQITIQDILPLVQKPSRYLGCEANSIKKSWNEVSLHFALAFPDLYEIATSHFGIQILYSMLNEQKDILAERVFAPAGDMENQLREKNLELFSLESKTPLKNFDIIGFSLLYELNYTNMVNMFDLSSIPFFTSQRNINDPFVIGGGPCMCNPEPVADFFDAIVVGDGEAVILKITSAWKEWKNKEEKTRKELLQAWSGIDGVYIPSFFDVRYDESGRQLLKAKYENYQAVERAVISDLDDSPLPGAPIIPFGKPIHDRLRMEIARGCTRGCRFCQAGMIYRPVRERKPEKIVSSVRRLLEDTGYEDLSLLSLSTGDYSCIASLMDRIMAFAENEHVAISLPSLRAGSLTPELMTIIKKVRKTGFTIAPEAGSQRLRNVINKNISEADIVQTVEDAFSMGWKLIKLYFMIGLPTETQADLEAIIDLVNHIRKIVKEKGTRGKINVSVATFVPKPHTPFQWEPQISIEQALNKMKWLKERLKTTDIQMKWQDPRVSMIEGVWSRGDRRLNRILIDAWKSGCRFDGWTEYFNYDRWISIFNKANFNPQIFRDGVDDKKGPLPWDHIGIGVDKSYLENQNDLAIQEEITLDCRRGACSSCGVCDFKKTKPISFHKKNDDLLADNKDADQADKLPSMTHKYLVKFTKMGIARFIGHLEMIKLFIRGIRRAKLPVKYSAGFHPMPKISFMDTLPTGIQSQDENMIISLTEAMYPEEIITRLKPQMPEGIEILGCSEFSRKDTAQSHDRIGYRVKLNDGFFSENDLKSFFEKQQVYIQRTDKKGKAVQIDLKKAVEMIEIIDGQNLRMVLKKVGNRIVRPSHMLRSLFTLREEQLQSALITKRKAAYV